MCVPPTPRARVREGRSRSPRSRRLPHDREREWRKSKRYGEIRNMVHFFDFEAAEAAEVSPSWLSDKSATGIPCGS